MGKIRIPVYIQAWATKCIGYVEIKFLEEFENAANELLEETNEDISTNITNDFEVGDEEIQLINQRDFNFYKEDQTKEE